MNDDTSTPHGVADSIRPEGGPVREADWESVRERVRHLGDMLNSERTSEQEAELLDRRARELARKPDDGGASRRLQLVRITLGDSAFVVPAVDVAAVVRGAEVAPLPGSTGPVVALAAWRGLRTLPTDGLDQNHQ